MQLAFNFKLLHQNQSQKEVVFNENFLSLSHVLNRCVKAIQNTPTNNKNDLYIIGKNPNGEWKNYADNVTFFNDVWHFVKPSEGMIFWVYDEKAFYVYKNLAWSKI